MGSLRVPFISLIESTPSWLIYWGDECTSCTDCCGSHHSLRTFASLVAYKVALQIFWHSYCRLNERLTFIGSIIATVQEYPEQSLKRYVTLRQWGSRLRGVDGFLPREPGYATAVSHPSFPPMPTEPYMQVTRRLTKWKR